MTSTTEPDAISANAVTGLFGLSGSGKTRQCDEGVRDVAERHGLISRLIVPDLGGWGTSRQSLIDQGIAEVYFPCNHVEPFATMELLSHGWWPEAFIDPRTGLADPEVAFLAPRVVQWTLVCANGHDAVTLASAAEVAKFTGLCPTCQAVVTPATVLRIDREIVRPAYARRVGLLVFDSFTQLNEWGLSDRAEEGAKILPGAGDAAMRSALQLITELPEGKFVFGGNDKTHYGFLQNRTRGWIQNIRAIPDQVERAILTFGVEAGKGDDESGGVPCYGPKIAGNARTSSVPGWLGNCLHLEGPPFRIWLTKHTDPNDPRQWPYLCKTRTEPGLWPSGYLEDAANEQPFTTCSLRKFYQLERDQMKTISATDAQLAAKLKAAFTDAKVLKREAASTAAVTASAEAPAAMQSTGRVITRTRRPSVTPPVIVTVPAPVSALAPSSLAPISLPAASNGGELGALPLAAQTIPVATGRVIRRPRPPA